jgi:hypothetical protein
MIIAIFNTNYYTLYHVQTFQDYVLGGGGGGLILRLRQQAAPKSWYLSVRLEDATSQNIAISIFTPARIKDLIQLHQFPVRLGKKKR